MDRVLQAEIEQDPLLHTAVEWFLELRSKEVSGERVIEWQRWLAEHERHRNAFERIESLWTMRDRTGATQWPTDAELTADTYDGEESISAWRARCESTSEYSTEPSSWRNHRHTSPAALAASIAAILVALGWAGLNTWPELSDAVRGKSMIVAETAVGEMRTLSLSDGSTVTLGGRTALNVTFKRGLRDIGLERGEVFFRVAKDPARPFTVRAGGTLVTAVGTAFNVRQSSEHTVVSVAEGIVSVSAPEPVIAPDHITGSGSPQPAIRRARSQQRAQRVVRTAQLQAGKQLSIGPTGVPPQFARVNMESVAGWRSGRLQYLNEPLHLVIEDLARYSTREIRIGDARVGELRVTGIVFSQNIDKWLESLQTTLPVDLIQEPDGAIRLQSPPHLQPK